MTESPACRDLLHLRLSGFHLGLLGGQLLLKLR